MRPFTIPAAFTVLFVLLAAAVHRLVLVPYRETRKIYEQFVMGYVMEDLFKVRYPFSPESEQAILRLNEIIDRSNLIAISKNRRSIWHFRTRSTHISSTIHWRESEARR